MLGGLALDLIVETTPRDQAGNQVAREHRLGILRARAPRDAPADRGEAAAQGAQLPHPELRAER